MADSAATTRVLIFTQHFRITGDISLIPGARLTDYMVEAKNFVAVSNAEVKNLDGQMVMNSTFLDVHRDSIELIVQLDQITAKSYGLGIQ